MRRRRAVVAAALAWALVVTGCRAEPEEEPDQPEPDQPTALQPQTSLPSGEVTLLAEDDPGRLALEVSRALYDSAPAVVLTSGTTDPDDAATRAVELGVPLLLTPADAPDEPALPEELTRLGVETALTYGGPATRWARQLDSAIEVVPADEVVPAGLASPGTGSVPPVTPAEPLASLAVLVPDPELSAAAAATAEAAGARVLATSATDPRTDPELITALAAEPPTHTLALGPGLGPADRLRDRLAVATTGVQLPGGGQVLFPGRRIVALYGHPGDSGLGVLGEQPRGKALARAAKVAAEYEALVDEPVVPALEIITTIASGSAGPAGDYSRRTPIDRLRGWVDAAADAGCYVVLDLQPGHTDFLTQAKEYQELLVEPHVGLALDPEWRLAPDQRHMVNIGSVDAAEVNQVVDWLADLTAEHRLPQKLLILHQFQLRMITDREQVDTSRDELAVLIHADGFGSRPQKHATWDRLHADPPEHAWWGWKNFYDEDRPTFTPDETVAVAPSPVFISYQ